ncbi:PTS system mannose/fructose/sorbose family transporter subunit IID [Collinsella sp. AGMB00827]|uniref:PTS system mannose/fructose/sorbose family transporter subunit IID n=1 Tax=Collinsella ureilytica TaxID=2869515 RepID=A0ABS7MI59_9ACTN|nr:PTS system mannose/fructose/sorbose family transporter subunit IID [Collinsella urealyticum]MBY4797029.1 PTS system mannose/fructose/sorbose family transporter subunit IID [Collinsella urealyticum]
MDEKRIRLTRADRMSSCLRHQFLQGSWNYERMQNGGWCYAMIPAIRKLYPNKDDRIAALKRHMEFYNTHPYVSAPVLGVTLALEEDRANGAQVEDATIQGVKVGMMGPLAGVGDPVFWFTLRPILGALGAGLALSGNIAGPLLFFFAWNIIRLAFLWWTQEFGYRVGTSITKDLSGGLMGRITEGASILGMFIIGALVQRWVSISFTPIVSQVQQSPGAFIDWAKLPLANGGVTPEGLQMALMQYADLGRNGLDQIKTTTLQGNLDQLVPGLAAVGLTLLCCFLLKRKVSPIAIIVALFVVGIAGRLLGLM